VSGSAGTYRGAPEPARVVAGFSYFEMSDLMGDDGALALALDSALERLEAACRCETWGQFARLLGYTWKDFVSEWGSDLESFTGRKRPPSRQPLDFAAVWGGDSVTALIQDPRQVAHDFLVAHVPAELLEHPRLAGVLEWGSSSPGGGIDAFSTSDPAGFDILAAVLQDAGYTGLEFRRIPRPAIFGAEEAL
jgi:hypothetical protein